MKDLIKRSIKNKGMQKERAKTKLKAVIFSLIMLFAIGSLAVGAVMESELTGIELVSAVGGTLLIAAPVLVMPAELKAKMSDDEVELYNSFLKTLSGEMNKEISRCMTDPNEDVVKNLKEIAKKQVEEYGLSEDTLKKYEKLLDEQAKTIKSIQEKGGTGLNADEKINPYKKQILEQLPKMRKAYKESKDNNAKDGGFQMLERSKSTKAIDEHNPDLIVTTENIITGDGIDWLGGAYSESTGLFRVRRPIEYIRSIINITRVANVPQYHYWDEEGDETGAFAIVEENELKPQVGLSLVRYRTTAQKAAGYIVVTEEVLKWKSRFWAQIQILFRAKLERDYNRLLNNELITNAVAYPGTALDGTLTNPSDIDAIAAAALATQNLNFVPDTIVINPTDWWRLLLTQANNGTYIFMPFIDGGNEPRLFGLRVIVSNYVAPGSFYLGESGTWYVEEEAPTVRSGWVNDDFIHNRMTIIGEIFFLSYVPAVFDGAWIAGNFNDIKDALQV